MKIYDRKLLKTLVEDLKTVPAVVLYGPRQVGKTTLVKQIKATQPDKFLYLDLELPSDRAKLSEPELFLNHHEAVTVILDEVQFVPDLFPVLRSLIDQNRSPGRFLLLGSASPLLLQQSSESLAGRVRFRELYPLTITEIETEKQKDLWFKGGFPEAFLNTSDKEAMNWQANFLRSYVTRDLSLLGLSMPSGQTERLLQMIAHVHGSLANKSTLSRALGVSQPTVGNALYFFEEALLTRTLKPWYSNTKKRLVKTPKLYFRDPGILHYLLSISDYNELLGHPQVGNSWEGFVVQQIISVLPASITSYFYRTATGAELDLLLVKGIRVWMAIEIKMGKTPKLTRGNTQAIQDVRPEHQIVISHSTGTFPLKNQWINHNLQSFLHFLQTQLN